MAFLYGTILIDLINGSILIRNPETSFIPGQIYKLFFLILIFSYISKLKGIALRSVVFLFIGVFFQTLYDGNISHFLFNIMAESKLVLFILCMQVLFYLSKKKKITVSTLIKLANFTMAIIIINQLIGLLGFGHYSYNFNGQHVGTTGFFFEGNSYSIIFLVITSILLMYYAKRVSVKKFVLLILFCVLLAFTIATKVAMGGMMLIALFALFQFNKKYFLVLLLLVTYIIVVNYEKIGQVDQVLRIVQNIEEKGPEYGVFSGREVRLDKSISDYFLKFSFPERIFGIGYYGLLNNLVKGGTAEIDFIDILKMSGLIGFFIVYFSFGIVCFLQIKQYKRFHLEEFKMVFFINILFLLISSSAGHLFTNGSAPIYLSLLNIYPFLLNEEYSYQKNAFDKSLSQK